MADGAFAKAVDSLAQQPLDARISGVAKRRFDYRIYVTDARGIVVYDSAHRDVGKDFSRWNDVYLTLRGKYGARSTRSDPDDDSSSVMHVAAAVRDGDRTVGVLTVAKANKLLEPFIAASQRDMVEQCALLLGLSFLIGLAVTFWLAGSVERLHRYAQAVTAGERVPAPDVGGGELGELGRALATMRSRLDGKQYVEQYVQTLAHEMKSPLAAIRGAAEILLGDPPEDDRRRFLGNIDGQSQRLAGLIDKMLALAALEHRQALENPEPVDLKQLAEQVCAALEPRLAAKSLRLSRQLPTESLAVHGDRFLLAQALENLLDNAIGFSPANGEITLELRRESDTVVLRVRDSGPGVPDYAERRVFDRFYSLPRPDGARSSGLGLSFVREVASLHGGQANLGNPPEGGALAELRLPG
jgi:two-component system sensor histidine kinase CreC